MVNIREQHDSPDFYYQAEVCVHKHSEQCACFATKSAAEHWANDVQARIEAADTIKAMRHPEGY